MDKSKNRKTITHFSAQEPKIAGSTLTQKEKKAIMRELSRKKRSVLSFLNNLGYPICQRNSQEG